MPTVYHPTVYHANSYFPSAQSVLAWLACSLFFKFFFFTMLFSAIQQHESAPVMHISPSYGASLLYSHPISLDHHRAPDWTPVLHPLLGIYPEEITVLKNARTPSFIAALFTTVRTQKQPRCLSTHVHEWIKKMYIYTMAYYSAIKKNKFESVLVRWLNLELIIQSEVTPFCS